MKSRSGALMGGQKKVTGLEEYFCQANPTIANARKI
jgi:hypothetical protein